MGLVYSPLNRDLLDADSGGLYEVESSVHFAAYRKGAALLYRARVPFDVVLDTDTRFFNRYAVLVVDTVALLTLNE